jgi:DNA-nicking Smr family endonuclease
MGESDMVWNNDLAKLKQDLKTQEENGTVQPPAKPVKASSPPAVPKSLDEEDALFLSAVGKATTIIPRASGISEDQNEFKEAMSQLKGIKQSRSDIPVSSETPKAASEQRTVATEKGAESVAVLSDIVSKDLSEREDGIELIKKLPEKIQLAAGMVIEVDGVLDLRNHTVEDARERLKERVLDGVFLGWRSLHVILGNSEPLNQTLIGYINSPQSHLLSRYAQAPVPMGGTQAWILYYGVQNNKLEEL